MPSASDFSLSRSFLSISSGGIVITNGMGFRRFHTAFSAPLMTGLWLASRNSLCVAVKEMGFSYFRHALISPMPWLRYLSFPSASRCPSSASEVVTEARAAQIGQIGR